MDKFLRAKIASDGPLSVAEFMKTILTNKSGGYYMSKDVFGRRGDFITAPEISQLFGEMVAVSLVSKLSNHSDSNAPIHLIELGPGRGTLMKDVLRTMQSFPHFFSRIQKCSLIEVSPFLRNVQQENLNAFSKINFNWHDSVEELSTNEDHIPLFIAQEFFDALPVHVFKHTEHGKWKELFVNYSLRDGYCLMESDSALTGELRLKDNFSNWSLGETLELSPQSWSICSRIKKILQESKEGGAGIFIDYGHFRPSIASLRAIYKHQFCGLFEHLGEADLSVDVDFQSLMHFLGPDNKYHFSTQGQFLQSMGITERLHQLCQRNPQESDTLQKSVHRLTSPQEMGQIYKVLQFGRLPNKVTP